MSDLVIRPMTPTDVRFIRDSWMKSYWKSGDAPHVALGTFQKHYGEYVNRRLLGNVRVACFADVPDEILGYAVIRYGAGVVDWVYVKAPYRRQRIATRLVEGITAHTHDTKMGRKFFPSVKSQYNPWL